MPRTLKQIESDVTRATGALDKAKENLEVRKTKLAKLKQELKEAKAASKPKK